MRKVRKGASKMTDVLTNFENIMDDYSNSKKEKTVSKLEFIITVWQTKRILKNSFAQKIIKENIIKDKRINQGRATIKGTRITPEDIGRIIENETNVTLEKIRDEFPSIENKDQVLAGVFVFMKDRLKWKEILLSK